MSDTSQKTFPQPLTGGALVLGTLCLAMANFLAILDTTIANVSVSNIAGSLGTSTSQGTYVITSYAVAEAISVPLTGWLASRFGALRVFVICLLMFGVFSTLCGMASSMNMLVLFRVFLGFSGGPLMPLSQTLMMRIFPRNKGHVAIGIWSMTTLVAPIMGPILGGVICDQFSWHYIFICKTPFAILAGLMCWKMLQRYETQTAKSPIDVVGLVLLVVWVSALQIMLDEGKDHDWFASTRIIVLAIIALIGFISFLIWELTERNPVVDLKVFRHRGFTTSMVTLSLAFGAFFGITVLTPLWLQIYMGYTATIAGYSTATMGVLAYSSRADRQPGNQNGPASAGLCRGTVAGIVDAISQPGGHEHDLLTDQFANAVPGDWYAAVLRAAYRHCTGVRAGSRDGFRRRADEFYPYSFGRVCHLDGQHLVGKPDPLRACGTGGVDRQRRGRDSGDDQQWDADGGSAWFD